MAYAFSLASRMARLGAFACSALVLTVIACSPEKALESVTEAESETPTARLNAAALVRSRGIAYGDFHLEPGSMSDYTGTLRAISPSTARSVLQKAQATGVRVFIALAVSRELSADSKGKFDFPKWKKSVDRFKNSDFAPYIADGTIVGHYIIDEPYCAGCWGGSKISDSMLDEMARYSKAIWPKMAVGVRMGPSLFEDVRQKYVDFGWAQWEGPLHLHSYRDSPEQFRDREVAAAKKRGMGIVFGMNYINGGDGSSGVLGTYANAAKVKRFAMSAEEVKRVGAVLAAAPYACGLISWKTDAKFDARPGMSEAKRHVGSVAANREAQSCSPSLGSGTPPPVEEPPTDSVPETPTDSTPEVPTDSVPGNPTDSVPGNPTDSVPGNPTDSVPGNPTDSVPEAPTDTTPVPPPPPPRPPPVDPVPPTGNQAGIAFGDYQLNPSAFASPYTGAFKVLSPSTAKSYLDKARAARVRVVVALAANSGGAFNLAKWKKEIDRYRGVNLSSYIADGTIVGHYLVSSPHCSSCWGGKAVPAGTLEEMARYSKALWPQMAAGVGAPPSLISNIRYKDVDFAWAQWEGPLHTPSTRMTPERFRDAETAAAQQRGLALVFGLNYLDGGDGSSRIAGTYKNATSKKVNRWQMSADEVKRVGAVFAAAPYACAIMNRNGTSTFDSRRGMMDAKRHVSEIAKKRSKQSCL